MRKEIQQAKPLGRPVAKADDMPMKEKILFAAIELFSLNGYTKTSVRQIARAVDVTEGAIYRHYASKEEVLDAVFSYARKFIFTPLPIEDQLDNPSGVSVFRGLLAPLPQLITSMPVVIKVGRIMYQEMQSNEKIRSYYLQEFVRPAEVYIEELFVSCMEKGLVIACDATSLANVFNAFRSEWTFRHFIVGHDSEDIGKLEDELERHIQFFEQMFSIPESHKGAVHRV
jgi:AcrR family transcriptional regulator